MRRAERRRGSLLAVLCLSLMLASCSLEQSPEIAPTLAPVLPPLPSATPPAAIPTVGATATPVPLGQGQSTPVVLPPGGAAANECTEGRGATRLPGLRYGVDIAEGAALDRALDQAQELNAGWVRVTLHWSDLEPQQAAFQWNALDALIAGTQSRELRVLLAVSQSPAWVGSGGGLPTKPEDFGSFMGALAGHAAGKVGAYEIWPNANSAAANGGTPAKPEQYVELLRAGHDAIKRADPCALVLTGALQPAPPNDPAAADDLAFLRGILADDSGATRDLFDILAVQLNTSGAPGKGKWPRDDMAQSRGFFGHVNFVRDEMTAADAADKQVWVVRVGYGVDGEHAVSSEEQAKFLSGLFDLTRQSNPWISAMFARDLGADSGFSLTNPDGSPRDAFNALRDYFASARAERDGSAAIEGTDLALLWQFHPNPEPIGQLVAGPDGAIYTQTANGYVRAIDPNGALRLTVKPARKRVPGVTADAEGRIYASGDNGALSAYTPGGNFLWSVLADGTPTTQLLLSADGQALYTGTSNDQIDAYAADDGHKLWSVPLGDDPGEPALDGDGTVYVGVADGELHAIAPDGTERWRYAAGGFARAAPVVVGDALYGVTDAGVAFALDMAGKQFWRVELDAPAIGLTTNSAGVFVTTADGTLHALALDGASRWTAQLGGGQPTAPAVGADGRVYIGSEDGRLRVVGADGTVEGSFDAGAPLRIAPLVGSDGAVYVEAGDKRNAVLAFGAPELKQRYNAP